MIVQSVHLLVYPRCNMESLIDRLKRTKNTYKMHSDEELRNAEQCKLKVQANIDDADYTESEWIDDLKFIAKREANGSSYLSFYNELKHILDKYDKPINFEI